MQAIIELPPGEEREVVIILGEAETAEEARSVASKYKQASATEAIEAVVSYWDELLSTVTVKTPDPTMDIMLNRWLLYQATSCRVWARSAFYQSGGAY